MEDIDEICNWTERIISYFLFIKNLHKRYLTILSSIFLLFQFLILFHYIIHCEKVFIRTNLEPVGIYYATDYIFLFSGTDMFKLFISILRNKYCLCNPKMFLSLLLFYGAIFPFRQLKKVRICFVMSILNFQALVYRINSLLLKK